MKISNVNTSIVLYGEISSSSNEWLQWFEYSKDLAFRLGHPANHIGVKSKSFTSGKLLKLNRSEKKLVKALNEGEELEYLGLDSLPEEYKIAAFDYSLSISRNLKIDPPHILLTMGSDDFKKIDSDKVILELKEFIDIEYGEIIELASSEIPQIYAVKGKPTSSFKELNILKKII